MIYLFASDRTHLLSLLFATLILTISACNNPEKPGNNRENKLYSLTEQEKAEGWEILFNGESLNHWRGANKASFPDKGWNVEGGVLTVEASDGSQEGWGGDIVTKDTYRDFELSLDFRLTRGANSGIKYYVLEDIYEEGTALGLEYQLLDDKHHPDAKQGRNGNRTVASLYDLIPADKDKPVNLVGEWNHARIVARNNKIEHWLNGKKVLEYERGGERFRNLISQSKYSVYQNFGEAGEGHILLQDHGNEVSFRNIKIRKFSQSDS